MKTNPVAFHGYFDHPVAHYNTATTKRIVTENRKLCYRFSPHFHPYVDKLISRLLEKTFSGLQAADTEYQTTNGKLITLPDGTPKPVLYEELFSPQRYNPSPELVDDRHPVKDLDFSSNGAYAVYNWELFYHVPFTIALHLSKNQHYEEAQRWFHYVFDPTDDSDGPTPERFWKVKPFQSTDVALIEKLLINLASNTDPALREETINNIREWQNNPFRPHVIARFRPSAYMLKTVMAYLDNLIAWGDSLFLQDTGESINEAMQLYVLAANILGPRPDVIPKQGAVQSKSYASLRNNLDPLSNALKELEADLPSDQSPYPGNAINNSKTSTITSLGKALYFCVPRNEKLLSYWNIIADRLFKIRNSLNSQGIFRQLPLFDPPIDPALLAKAAASGLDVGAIVSGLNQPLPLVRFVVLIQKAAEICQEVKSLGSTLLSVIEKEDNEALSILRAQHESNILRQTETIRYQQWQEAIKNREGLEQSLDNAVQRYGYYESLLGNQGASTAIPQMELIESDRLQNMSFQSHEPRLPFRPVEIDTQQEESGGVVGSSISLDVGGLIGAAIGNVVAGPVGGAIGAAIGDALIDPINIANASADPSSAKITGGRKLSSYEGKELAHLQNAHALQGVAGELDRLASGLSLLPQLNVHGTPLGVGVAVGFGGDQLSKVVSMIGSAVRSSADQQTFQATTAAKIGYYARREQDWAFQSNVVIGEINLIFKQLRAAQIREHLTQQEWKNHQQQTRFAEDIERFFKDEKTGKVANSSFYNWMKGEVKGLYAQYFQFAFQIAKKAERALQHELGNYDLGFLQFSYLAGKQGLLAGEKLHLDIKRMETAYQELNQREYELTKHVSLFQVNPEALLQLRVTGHCTVSLPEELFDMDGPGHYFRRIKSVAVSLPSIAGPYTSINCTLTLLKSSIRKNSLLSDQDTYARQDSEDSRFSEYFGSLQSVVTSSGQNDSGLFEANTRDERYLPFEGAGVISEWKLELPESIRQFDYDTIADVIFHLRYTAREGGGLFKTKTVEYLEGMLEEGSQQMPLKRLFSLRHEFSSEWHHFIRPAANQAQQLTFNFQNRFPYFTTGRLIKVNRITFIAATVVKPVNSLAMTFTINEAPTVPISLELDMLAYDKWLQGVVDLNDPITIVNLTIAYTPVDQASLLTEDILKDIFVLVDYQLVTA